MTRLLQNLDSFLFSRSVVDLLVCLGSLSCCMTQLWPNFSCQTDALTFDSGILWDTEEFMRLNDCEVPRSCGYKTCPKSSALHQHVWLLVWVVCADMLVRFSPNVLLCIMAKHLHSGLICSKVIEDSWFVQMQLCKPKTCCHAFLDRRSFPLTSLPKHAILVPYFSTCTVMNFIINMLTEARRVCGEVLGLSTISLSITRSDLGVNLLGCPLLGELVSVLNVFHLRLIYLTEEWWTSHCLEMAVCDYRGCTQCNIDAETIYRVALYIYIYLRLISIRPYAKSFISNIYVYPSLYFFLFKK